MRTAETRLEQAGAITSLTFSLSHLVTLFFFGFCLPLCGCIYWSFVLSICVDIDVNHSTGQKSPL